MQLPDSLNHGHAGRTSGYNRHLQIGKRQTHQESSWNGRACFTLLFMSSTSLIHVTVNDLCIFLLILMYLGCEQNSYAFIDTNWTFVSESWQRVIYVCGL